MSPCQLMLGLLLLVLLGLGILGLVTLVVPLIQIIPGIMLIGGMPVFNCFGWAILLLLILPLLSTERGS